VHVAVVPPLQMPSAYMMGLTPHVGKVFFPFRLCDRASRTGAAAGASLCDTPVAGKSAS